MRSRAIGVTLVLAALLALGACGGVGNPGSTGGFVSGNGAVTVVDPGDREKAPELTGVDLDGAALSTSDYAGTVQVINVWGPWCAPCRAEAPVLKELSDSYAGRVQFLGILNRSKDDAAAAFNRRQGITYPSFADRGGRLELGFVDSLPSQAIPTTWVIDAQGRVAARLIDEVDASTLGDILDDVLAEGGSGS